MIINGGAYEQREGLSSSKIGSGDLLWLNKKIAGVDDAERLSKVAADEVLFGKSAFVKSEFDGYYNHVSNDLALIQTGDGSYSKTLTWSEKLTLNNIKSFASVNSDDDISVEVKPYYDLNGAYDKIYIEIKAVPGGRFSGRAGNALRMLRTPAYLHARWIFSESGFYFTGGEDAIFQTKLDFDDVPTKESTKVMTSGAIFNAFKRQVFNKSSDFPQPSAYMAGRMIYDDQGPDTTTLTIADKNENILASAVWPHKITPDNFSEWVKWVNSENSPLYGIIEVNQINFMYGRESFIIFARRRIRGWEQFVKNKGRI